MVPFFANNLLQKSVLLKLLFHAIYLNSKNNFNSKPLLVDKIVISMLYQS